MSQSSLVASSTPAAFTKLGTIYCGNTLTLYPTSENPNYPFKLSLNHYFDKKLFYFAEHGSLSIAALIGYFVTLRF